MTNLVPYYENKKGKISFLRNGHRLRETWDLFNSYCSLPEIGERPTCKVYLCEIENDRKRIISVSPLNVWDESFFPSKLLISNVGKLDIYPHLTVNLEQMLVTIGWQKYRLDSTAYFNDNT